MDATTEPPTALNPHSAPDPRIRGLIRTLVDRRQALRLSQTDVASKMGTSQSAVARLEAGEADPRVSTLERYARAIDAELVPVVRATLGHSAVPPAGLVNADDLENWAGEIGSQNELAELVRRLIQATAGGITDLRFPTGAGVQQEGWDGVATVKHGNAYVPVGRSVWELGIGDKIKRKAEEDLDKRSKDPLGVVPSDTSFIFVSLRRWRGRPDSGTWARQKQATGPWRAVRVLDADDLADWLELAPAVHYWLSERRGKFPNAARPLDTWWDEWAGATLPPVSAALVLAGRTEAAEKLTNHLGGPAGALMIRAESRDEALAFVAAVIERLPAPQRDTTVPRCLIVKDERGWRHAAASSTGLILIPWFEGVTLTTDVASRHHVIVPLGNESAVMPGAIELSRLDREAAEEALRKMLDVEAGEPTRFTPDDAADLARVARLSLLSLRRRLAVSRALERPAWAEQSDVGSVTPLVLVGSWHERKGGDNEILARLLRRPYRDLSQELQHWARRADPLIRRVGDVWYIVDREDAWMLLAPQLMDTDIGEFTDVVMQVLGTPLPATELPPEDQWRAALLDLVPRVSGVLRQALAETLALMGSRSDIVEVAGGHHGKRVADGIVSRLLAAANEDESGRLWASISKLLPLLAEAAPEVFLDAVDGGPSSESSMVQMFTDWPDRVPIFSSSPHTGLLWALETLAWHPEYLGRVAQVLARLTELDPGGSRADRPSASLRQILLSWHPQTTATVEQRLTVIDSVVEQMPDVGWELLVSLLPQSHDLAMPTHPPRFRDWKPSGQRRVTMAELGIIVEELVQRMLWTVGDRGTRWKSLVGIVSSLPLRIRDEVLGAMERLDLTQFDEQGRLEFRDALREETGRHRKYARADWALPKETVDRLAAVLDRMAASEGPRGAAWLFTHRPPTIPDVDEDDEDWQAYPKALDNTREEALRLIYEESGLRGLQTLADQAQLPNEVGRVVGERHVIPEGEEAEVLNDLVADMPARRWWARGYVSGRHRTDSASWANAILRTAEDWAPERRAALLLGFPVGEETWKLAARFGEETDGFYWNEAPAWAAPDADYMYAVEKLLAYGRPHHAVDVLAHRVHGDATADQELIFRALKLAATTEPSGPRDNMFAYDVGRLLDYLAGLPDVDAERLAGAELSYVELLRFTRPPKFMHRRVEANPRDFAEILSWVFKPEGDETREITERVRMLAQVGYALLDTWKGMPGIKTDGTVDGNQLEQWVDEAHRLCVEQGRHVMGEQYIGRALAHAPQRDEAWPPDEVCSILDRREFKQVRRGFEIEVYNSRGVVTRGLTDGGVQERALAAQYASWAKQLAGRWPRVAATLSSIADEYVAQAEREDVEAQLRQDHGW